MSDVELKLQAALLRAELLERGVHPIAVRGLLADDAITAKLAGADITALASDIVRDLPRSMFKDAESPEKWAKRRFGGTPAAVPKVSVGSDYIAQTYSAPSRRKSEGG